MTSIILIQQPQYEVDFSAYGQTPSSSSIPPSTIQQIRNAATFCIDCIKFFFIALNQSLYDTGRYAGISFKRVVLNLNVHDPLYRYKPTKDLPLIVIKLATWVLGTVYCAIATTGRLWMRRFAPTEQGARVRNYATEDINIAHIRTDDLALDASGVPTSITVNSLSGILNEINFDDEKDPFYMAPESRKENTTTFTKEELQTHLTSFIRRVNNREAFLGTPAAYDTPRLMAFYQQIEDAVRLSIHKIEEQLSTFRALNGKDASAYNTETMNAYKNILEDRSRIAIDLAIAGSHCGARYMGEAMSVYNNTFQGESSSNDKNLEETIVDILAQKRRGIAEEQIQRHLGTDTHAYANYMGTLGESLALPGTKNVIEQLASPIDKDRYLTLFFKEYTTDTIIDTIQEKIKSSHSFREKITDWVRDQVNQWSPLSEEQCQQLMSDLSTQIEAIVSRIDTPAESSSAEKTPLENLQLLLIHLKQQNIALPAMENGWDDFIIELTGIEEVKEWCNENLAAVQSARHIPPAMAKRNAFKNGCLVGKLGEELVANIQAEVKLNATFDAAQFARNNSNLFQKISEIRGLFNSKQLAPPQDETIQRMISSNASINEIITASINSMRSGEFVHQLKLETMHSEGLSSEILEWLLVSQNILNPQKSAVQETTGPLSDRLPAPHFQKYMDLVMENCKQVITPDAFKTINAWFDGLQNASPEQIEQEAEIILNQFPQLNGKRYRFATSNRDRLLKAIFEKSFNKAPDAIINAAEAASIVQGIDYSRMKSVCHITIPKTLGTIAGVLGPAAAVAIFVATIFAGYKAYAIIKEFFAEKVIPFLTNHLPAQALQIGSYLSDGLNYIRQRLIVVLISLWLFKKVIDLLPEIPYLTKAVQRISAWEVFCFFFINHETIGLFLLRQALRPAKFVADVGISAARYFHSIGNMAKTARLHTLQQKAFKIWVNGFIT